MTLTSKDGIVGSNMHSLRMETTRLESGDILVLTTDGVKERFSLNDLPAPRESSPASIARLLLRRFGKDYDDAACIVLKYKPGQVITFLKFRRYSIQQYVIFMLPCLKFGSQEYMCIKWFSAQKVVIG